MGHLFTNQVVHMKNGSFKRQRSFQRADGQRKEPTVRQKSRRSGKRADGQRKESTVIQFKTVCPKTVSSKWFVSKREYEFLQNRVQIGDGFKIENGFKQENGFQTKNRIQTKKEKKNQTGCSLVK